MKLSTKKNTNMLYDNIIVYCRDLRPTRYVIIAVAVIVVIYF